MSKEGLGGTSRTSSSLGSHINGVRQDLQLAIPKIWICSSFSGNQDSLIRGVSVWRPDLWGGLFFPYLTFIQHSLLTGKHLAGIFASLLSQYRFAMEQEGTLPGLRYQMTCPGTAACWWGHCSLIFSPLTLPTRWLCPWERLCTPCQLLSSSLGIV